MQPKFSNLTHLQSCWFSTFDSQQCTHSKSREQIRITYTQFLSFIQFTFHWITFHSTYKQIELSSLKLSAGISISHQLPQRRCVLRMMDFSFNVFNFQPSAMTMRRESHYQRLLQRGEPSHTFYRDERQPNF